MRRILQAAEKHGQRCILISVSLDGGITALRELRMSRSWDTERQLQASRTDDDDDPGVCSEFERHILAKVADQSTWKDKGKAKVAGIDISGHLRIAF